MALFKIEKGLAANLTSRRQNTVEGYCYFTTDDGKFYIDIATGNDLNNRVCLNAYKADKLNCGTIGSATQPVYFSDGIPVATTYSLNTTVPANAVFTDTGATSIAFSGSGNTLVNAEYDASTRTITFTKSSTNNYTLPLATSDTLGGVKIGYSQNGKNYPVQLSNEQMFVNVPWTDNGTIYSAGTGLSLSGSTFNHKNSIVSGSVGAEQSPAFGSAFSIPKITYDAQGHITSASTVNITLPAAQSIPTALPNPSNLTFVNRSGVVVNHYSGSAQVMLKAGTNVQMTSSSNSAGVPVVELSATNTTYNVATSSVAGLVKSGTDITVNANGEVSVNNADKVKTNLIVKLNGGSTEGTDLFTFNGSTEKTINVTPSGIGAAPANHAAAETTYGVGSGDNYGHVKLSDAINSANSVSNGIAATPKAVNAVYNAAAIKTANNIFSGTNTFTGSKIMLGVDDNTLTTGNIFLGKNNYGPNLPSSGVLGQLFFVEEETADLIGLPASTTSDSGSFLSVSSTTGNAVWSKVAPGANQTNTNYYLTAVTSNGQNFQYNGNIYIKNNVMQGAAWNDYAEYRTQKEIIEPGYCVASSNDGTVYKTNEKFQACDGIVSDTFGFAIGQNENCKTPLAVAGRVLAYCEGNREDYHAGDTVCAGPGGKVYKMTREEIREWPDRIIGIVSEIPEYEIWGENNIKVNNRIWIKVK